MGKFSSFLRSPKKEEQQVPDTIFAELSGIKDVYATRNAGNEIHIMDELEGIWGIEDDQEKFAGESMRSNLDWNFMEWEGFPIEEADGQLKEEEEKRGKNTSKFLEEEGHYTKVIKRESPGFWDHEDHENSISSLNLNLNYQDVLNAWSDRGSLWADHCSLSMPNNSFMGEVPVMEEERTRREASVLRYKEKRQSRLFSKKIRYQVRKLNADKRPRLKGRFVKRVPDKIFR
ncbi:hypothetical protein HHK36_010663 [Tetracentron sinense]|uniref:CCT domain-containing protein n=1 Tax=Tetracentron sinense TaxID=13715 RepID=A0A834ZEP9_TETSI|nr:hypothetical protein HHK36_010663 [Tetracentron sinense]